VTPARLDSAPDAGKIPGVLGMQNKSEGLALRFGPFIGRLKLDVPGLAEPLFELYRFNEVIEDPGVHSFHAAMTSHRSRSNPFRRWVRFTVDGQAPHEDMPFEQALPVLEWGINLVIALRYHCYLMLHAAVVERNGECMLMPAMPGDGKTTLSAALAQRGWRLFSDEFGLIRPGSDQMIPLPRPPALKNQSIEIIQSFEPSAHIGPSTAGTRKGTVAHLRPSQGSVARASETAPVGLIVFPRWDEGAQLALEPMGKADAFMTLGSNAFNFELQGEEGYDTVAALVDRADCYSLNYSKLDDAIEALNQLSDQRHD
jgi:HprK-related kinase A